MSSSSLFWTSLPSLSTNTKDLCYDGSPYGFYSNIDIFPTVPSTIVYYFQGGGGCLSVSSCQSANSSLPNPSLYSSSFHTESIVGDYLLSSDCQVNPLCNAIHIYLPYCSADFWIGNSVLWENQTNEYFYFKGRNIVRNVINFTMESIVNRWPSLSTSLSLSSLSIVISGSSAGALGMLHHLSDFYEMYQLDSINATGTLSVISDSGYWDNHHDVMTQLAQTANTAYNLTFMDMNTDSNDSDFPCTVHPTIPTCCFLSSCLLYSNYSTIPYSPRINFLILTSIYDVFILTLPYSRSLQVNEGLSSQAIDALPMYGVFGLQIEYEDDTNVNDGTWYTSNYGSNDDSDSHIYQYNDSIHFGNGNVATNLDSLVSTTRSYLNGDIPFDLLQINPTFVQKNFQSLSDYGNTINNTLLFLHLYDHFHPRYSTISHFAISCFQHYYLPMDKGADDTFSLGILQFRLWESWWQTWKIPQVTQQIPLNANEYFLVQHISMKDAVLMFFNDHLSPNGKEEMLKTLNCSASQSDTEALLSLLLSLSFSNESTITSTLTPFHLYDICDSPLCNPTCPDIVSIPIVTPNFPFQTSSNPNTNGYDQFYLFSSPNQWISIICFIALFIPILWQIGNIFSMGFLHKTFQREQRNPKYQKAQNLSHLKSPNPHSDDDDQVSSEMPSLAGDGRTKISCSPRSSPDIVSPLSSLSPPSFTRYFSLAVSSLSFSINNKVILHDISCDIQTGQLIGILGGSGSGKSTLIEILAGRRKFTSYEKKNQYYQQIKSTLWDMVYHHGNRNVNDHHDNHGPEDKNNMDYNSLTGRAIVKCLDSKNSNAHHHDTQSHSSDDSLPSSESESIDISTLISFIYPSTNQSLLHPRLTVRENIFLFTLLQLAVPSSHNPSPLSFHECYEHCNTIIERMNLTDCCDNIVGEESLEYSNGNGSGMKSQRQSKNVTPILNQHDHHDDNPSGTFPPSAPITSNRSASGLSSGQRKRVQIGLSLISDPLVLFCDEPTSSLDAHQAALLVNLFHSLVKKHSSCILLTIHQPRKEIINQFDCIWFMWKGEIVIKCSPKELTVVVQVMRDIVKNIWDQIQQNQQKQQQVLNTNCHNGNNHLKSKENSESVWKKEKYLLSSSSSSSSSFPSESKSSTILHDDHDFDFDDVDISFLYTLLAQSNEIKYLNCSDFIIDCLSVDVIAKRFIESQWYVNQQNQSGDENDSDYQNSQNSKKTVDHQIIHPTQSREGDSSSSSFSSSVTPSCGSASSSITLRAPSSFSSLYPSLFSLFYRVSLLSYIKFLSSSKDERYRLLIGLNVIGLPVGYIFFQTSTMSYRLNFLSIISLLTAQCSAHHIIHSVYSQLKRVQMDIQHHIVPSSRFTLLMILLYHSVDGVLFSLFQVTISWLMVMSYSSDYLVWSHYIFTILSSAAFFTCIYAVYCFLTILFHKQSEGHCLMLISIYNASVAMFSGFIIPLSVLPSWLRFIYQMNPLYYQIGALSHINLDGNNHLYDCEQHDVIQQFGGIFFCLLNQFTSSPQFFYKYLGVQNVNPFAAIAILTIMTVGYIAIMILIIPWRVMGTERVRAYKSGKYASVNQTLDTSFWHFFHLYDIDSDNSHSSHTKHRLHEDDKDIDDDNAVPMNEMHKQSILNNEKGNEIQPPRSVQRSVTECSDQNQNENEIIHFHSQYEDEDGDEEEKGKK